MSSDEAADSAEDPGHLRFIIMHATETFDGRERVFSRAAYDLQVLATAHSTSCGHPGFVPDDYLEHLDGLAIETPPCAVCGTPSARVELVAPGHLPAHWGQWPRTVQDSIQRQRQPGQWYLLFKGVATDNGYGDPIDASRAGRIAQAFRPPLDFGQVRTAGLYDDAGFCQDCDAPYCYRHWRVSESGYGYCPRGHGKSLDPHWQVHRHVGVELELIVLVAEPAILPLSWDSGVHRFASFDSADQRLPEQARNRRPHGI